MRCAVRFLVVCLAALPLYAALDFNSGNLGTVGMSNTIFLFTPTGGTGPYVFSYAPSATPIPDFRVFSAPELPSNATAVQKGGLAGLPHTAGLMSTTIRLVDTATSLFIDKAVSFTVSPVDLAGFGPAYYAVGDTVSQRFWPVGGTPPYSYTLSSGTLPPGLSLGTQVVNGVTVALVSGTILNTATTATTTATNQYNFTIAIHDSVGNTLGRGYSMTVSALQLWAGGSPLNGSGVNRMLPPATVGLAYSQQISVVGGTPPYTFTVESGNGTPNTITLSSSGLLSGTPTGSNFSGRFTFDVTDAANHFTSTRVSLRILPTTPAPLTLTTNIIGDGAVGDNADWEITASGGLPPYTFDIDPATPLPLGATIIQGYEREPKNSDPDGCFIRTKIQTPGTYTFTVRVADSAGNHASRPYVLNTRTISFSTVFPGNATLGVPYSRYLIPLGGTPPYTVSPVNIPAGLAIDNNALISGTPQEAGTFLPLIATLADSAGHSYTHSQGNFTLIASSTNPGLTLSGGDFGVAQLGSQYTSNLTAGGSLQSPPVFAVSLVTGTLPPGLRLLTGRDFNNGGNTAIAAQLAGIPNTPGNYTFVYRVVDGLGQVGQRQIKIRISGMSIVNTALAPATVGVPYTQTVDLRGGTAPFTYSLTTGSLPTGLSLNASTGTISGTPLSTSATAVTIQVQDNLGDILQRSFTLNIYPIQITGPDVLPNAFFATPYTYTFTPNPPGSYTFTGTGLPAGLTLNAATGALSGVATATGNFTITVTAFNNATSAIAVRSFTLFVPTLSGFIGGLPTAVVDVGGVPTAYLGDFVARTNLVTTLGVSGGRAPYVISLVAPSTLPPGLALAIGSTYQGTTNFNRWTIAGVATTPGLYTFKLRYTDADGISVDRVVAMNITTLGLATTAPGIGLVNQPYSAQLFATGGTGTYSFAVADIQGNVMPPGLALSPTGQITGTPTSTGAFSTTVQLTSGASTRRVAITTTINATTDNRRIDFGLNLGPLPAETSLGSRFASNLIPTGVPSSAGTHTWSLVAGTLPPGEQILSNANLPANFTPPSVLLTGPTTATGTFNYRIRVDDSTGNFGIRDGALLVTTTRNGPSNSLYTGGTTIPPAQIGSPYTFAFSAVNYRAPLTFTMETGTLLPPGMSFNSTGLLSGTPTAGGNFVLYFHRTDADGVVRHLSFAINVYPAGFVIPPQNAVANLPILPSGTLATAYNLTLNDLLSPGYGTPPFTWSVVSGALPPGIAIVPGLGVASASLSGTPTSAGTYDFTLLVTPGPGVLAAPIFLYQMEISISPIGLAPPTGALPAAIAGIPYLASFTASGGTPPYVFTRAYDSDMPGGLSLSSNGVLSGTATAGGYFANMFVVVKDSLGQTFRQRYSLNILPVGTVMPAFTLTPGSINISYTRGDPAPAPVPISVGSVSTALAYTVGTGGTPWLSVSATSGTTPGAPSALFNPGTMAPGNYTGAITFTSAGASNSPASIPVNLSIVNAVVCSYALSPVSATALASGGTGNFNVVAPATCAWTIDTGSLPPWIAINSPTSGSGNSVVNYTVNNNAAGTQRTGAINVNGLAFTITQFGAACSFTLLPATLSLPAAGGSGTIAVNASATGCTWSTTQVDSWIGLANGTGTGNGSGSVNLNFQVNPNGFSRAGTITIAGQTLTVNQTGVNCLFTLSSPGTTVGSSGGVASFDVTAATGCTWNADTGPGWITPTSPTTGSGNGTVTLSIAPNSTVNGRQANVLAGGQSFSIQQAGVPCSFSLSANNPVQPATGGSGSVDLSTNAGCTWTASSNVPWLTLAANTGTGAGTLNFTVAVNGTGASRSGGLTVVGQNITVNQSGPVCAYSLQASSSSVPGAGGTGSAGVLTPAGCGPWTASSNAPSWLHVTGAGPFTGPGSATYSVDSNLTGADRFSTLLIAGQTFSVTQPALACPVTLGTASGSFGEFGGNGQFTFTTTPPGCAVTVQSYSSWLNITSQSPPGTITFSVAPNTYAAARSGTIVVGDQNYTVNQSPSTCAYTLTSFAKTFQRLGGDGGVPMTFLPLQCGAPPVLVNGPAGMVTLTPGTYGSGTYTQNYTVSIYQSFINYVRTAQLVVNGQIYTVKQTSW